MEKTGEGTHGMGSLTLYAAPMEGLTTRLWRQTQQEIFGGVDKYFTPFLSPNANLSFQQKELDEIPGEKDTVPQLLTNQGDHFIWAARELKARGYEEVNFNLGCPSGTVTAKRKGAGLLADPEGLERCLDEIFDALPDMRVSVKTRIGKNDPAEWEGLLTLYSRYPIHELIVHPRIQKEFYRGAVHEEAFAQALAAYTGRLVYNGDLFTAEDVAAFRSRYPQVDTVMTGRGLVADPSLGRQVKGGARASRQELATFHDTLLERYCRRLSGETSVLHRMRELWNYLCTGFQETERPLKAIRKAKSLAAYEAAAGEILRNCPME